VTRRHRIPGIRANRVLFVLPEIADSDPVDRKNGFALRNACATEGKCPACGAVGELHADATHDGLFHLVFQHEDWCPVLTDEGA
jgi:hypothetical protein